jgi:Fe2+ transport system protein FeoA
LAASGLWAGAPIECMQRAPFGDPLLYRVHGYRLALRATEAAMVMVREVAR